MSATVDKYLYLMIKTHHLTGLKYLCKRVTTGYSKAISYKGSGKYWKNHLKIHGKNINTEILAKYELDKIKEFSRLCIEYSNKFNIIKSYKCANLIEQMKNLNSNNPSINILKNGDIGYFLRKDRIVKNVKGWTKI